VAKPRLDIPSGAKVLEIGSGHNPHPRSTVLCDRYLDDRERAGSVKVDRPFLLGDGGALPFGDGSFDYVIAIDVVEHADDIALFLGELARVARAGYIETPSFVAEGLFGWRKHRWALLLHEGTLYARRRQPRREFGIIFHELMRADAQLTGLYYRHPDLFRVRLEWQGSVPYTILGPEDPDVLDLDDPEVVAGLLKPAAGRQWLKAYMPRSLRNPIWTWWRDLRVRLIGGGRRR